MTAIESPCIIHVVTDYGSDNAVNEVIPRLRKYFGFGSVEILNSSIENFNTINNAFWVAQLALNAELPTLIYHNVAPRKDDTHARQDNRGEQLLGLRLDNGVVVVGPNSGYSLSLIKNHIVACEEIFIGGKSQFRSRDVFIEPAALFWRQDSFLETIAVDPELIIPELKHDVVLHIDNYGNIKTSITEIDYEAGEKIKVTIGDHSVQATVAGGAFQQEEGTLGLVPGSSGFNGTKFYELFYRGSRADELIVGKDGNEAVGQSMNQRIQPIQPGDKVVLSPVGQSVGKQTSKLTS